MAGGSAGGMMMGLLMGVIIGVLFKDQLSGLLGGLKLPGATPPATTPTECEFTSAPMESDPNQFRINDAAGKEAGGGTYYKTKAEADAKIAEMCATAPPAEGETPPAEEDEDKEEDEDEDEDKKSDYARAYAIRYMRTGRLPYADYY